MAVEAYRRLKKLEEDVNEGKKVRLFGRLCPKWFVDKVKNINLEKYLAPIVKFLPDPVLVTHSFNMFTTKPFRRRSPRRMQLNVGNHIVLKITFS